MNNFFARFRADALRESVSRILVRFPVAIAIIIGISVLFFMSLHGKFDTTTESMIYRMIFSAVVTFFLSVGISLHSESLDIPRVKNYLLQLLPVVFGSLFYLGFSESIDNEKNIVFFLLSLSGILAYLFFSPFIRQLFVKDVSQTTYYTYFYHISVVFLISAILGGVLALLGNVAIWSVITLFDLKGVFTEKLFGDWMIIALSFFAPIFALAQLPKRESFIESDFHENAFFSFLVKYIAIPFILVYFVILYVYSIKVLANFSEWPKGEVSWMVIGFSIFGYIIYIFSYIFEEKITFIRIFRKLFPMVVVPQLFMLFYAIYLRIAQYDITMNRYFVVVFGIWLTTISLYLIISRRKYLAMLPAILALFTIIVSVGPWSVYELPMARQMARLEHNLETAKILQNGKIVPLKTYGDIDKDLSREIYEGINYMCDFDDCEQIKIYFSEQYSKIEADARADFERQKKEDLARYPNDETYKKTVLDRVYEAPQKWTIVQKLGEMIRVQTYYGTTEVDQPYLNFRLADNINIYPLDVHGYGQLYKIGDYKTGGKEVGFRVDYDVSSSTLQVKQGEKIIDIIKLEDKFRELQVNYKTTRELQLPLDKMTYDTGKYHVIFESIDVGNPEYTGDRKDIYGYVNGYVLVK